MSQNGGSGSNMANTGVGWIQTHSLEICSAIVLSLMARSEHTTHLTCSSIWRRGVNSIPELMDNSKTAYLKKWNLPSALKKSPKTTLYNSMNILTFSLHINSLSASSLVLVMLSCRHDDGLRDSQCLTSRCDAWTVAISFVAGVWGISHWLSFV